MTVTVSPVPYLSFMNPNNSGSPAAGFKLFTYQAGTATKQATWTDSTQTVQNANPIVLDSNGAAYVWLDLSLKYKFLLTSPNDTDPPTSPLRTVDNLEGPVTNSTLTALLIANPSLIAQTIYPQTPSEIAAGVTPTNYTFPALNVRRYGADPSGATSSLSAFSAAYNVAVALVPHGAIYAPAGKYLIPSPGLSWNANDITFSGDGPNQTILQGSNSPAYTIMTVSQDTGAGTTGNNVFLSNFGINNSGLAGGTNGLTLADYQYCTLSNILINASGNALTLKGMALVTATDLNCLTWESNAAANTALLLGLDTASIPVGACVFNGCKFEGLGNVTAGAAITSTRTLSTVFNACFVQGLGPALTSVCEFTNDDDVTFIECYTEKSTNTLNNNAVLFHLGSSGTNVANFTLLGGTYFSGFGGFSAKNAVALDHATICNIANVTFAGFATSAISYQTNAQLLLTVTNTYSSGTGNPPVIDHANFAAGTGLQQLWTYPLLTWPIPINTGFGTPTGGSIISNFPGASATLGQCSATIAQLIAILKSANIVGV